MSINQIDTFGKSKNKMNCKKSNLIREFKRNKKLNTVSNDRDTTRVALSHKANGKSMADAAAAPKIELEIVETRIQDGPT